MTRYRPLLRVLLLPAIMLAGTGSVRAASYAWTQLDGSPQHTGNNTLEVSITRGNVSGLRQLFQVTLPGGSWTDGAPAYLNHVLAKGKVRDLLFITSIDGHLGALDAHTGQEVWTMQAGPGSCLVNGNSGPCYNTSSPAIDPNRQYVYSYGEDGYVHKYAVADGSEVKSGGWPELATRKGFDEKGGAALSIATDKAGATYPYASNGGYIGDAGDSQDHIT